MIRALKFWVGFDEFCCHFFCEKDDGLIAGEVSDDKFGESGLFRPENVAWSSFTQVDLGEFESVLDLGKRF